MEAHFTSPVSEAFRSCVQMPSTDNDVEEVKAGKITQFLCITIAYFTFDTFPENSDRISILIKK